MGNIIYSDWAQRKCAAIMLHLGEIEARGIRYRALWVLLNEDRREFADGRGLAGSC